MGRMIDFLKGVVAPFFQFTKRQKQVLLFLFGIGFFFAFGFLSFSQGMFPDKQEADSSYRFLRYAVENYQLDYSFVGEKGAFSSMKAVAGAFYGLTNFFWVCSLYLCKIGIYLLDMALEFDLVESALPVIIEPFGRLMGISHAGLYGGVFGTLFRFVVVALGIYVAFVGLVEKKYTEVWKSVGMFVLVLAISIGFSLHAKTYISTVNQGVNELTAAISKISLAFSTVETVEESVKPSGGSVLEKFKERQASITSASMGEMLFDIQIRKPWLCLQFGTTDEEEIGKRYGTSVVQDIESRSFGNADRETVVLEVISKDTEADRLPFMTELGNSTRLVSAFFTLVSNGVITFFVGLLSLLMIFSQVMFLIFFFLLPFACLIALLPRKEGVLKKSFVKIFLYLMVKLGLVVLLTVLFSVVGLLYHIAMSLKVPIVITQLCVGGTFFYVVKNIDSILTTLGIKESTGIQGIRGTTQKVVHAGKEVTRKGEQLILTALAGAGGYMASEYKTRTGQEASRAEKKEEERRKGLYEDVREKEGKQAGKEAEEKELEAYAENHPEDRHFQKNYRKYQKQKERNDRKKRKEEERKIGREERRRRSRLTEPLPELEETLIRETPRREFSDFDYFTSWSGGEEQVDESKVTTHTLREEGVEELKEKLPISHREKREERREEARKERLERPLRERRGLDEEDWR